VDGDFWLDRPNIKQAVFSRMRVDLDSEYSWAVKTLNAIHGDLLPPLVAALPGGNLCRKIRKNRVFWLAIELARGYNDFT